MVCSAPSELWAFYNILLARQPEKRVGETEWTCQTQKPQSILKSVSGTSFRFQPNPSNSYTEIFYIMQSALLYLRSSHCSRKIACNMPSHWKGALRHATHSVKTILCLLLLLLFAEDERCLWAPDVGQSFHSTIFFTVWLWVNFVHLILLPLSCRTNALSCYSTTYSAHGKGKCPCGVGCCVSAAAETNAWAILFGFRFPTCSVERRRRRRRFATVTTPQIYNITSA